MKKQHEEGVTKRYFISDEMAERIILLLAGGGAGYVIADLLKELGEFIGNVKRASDVEEKSRPGRRGRTRPFQIKAEQLLEGLRYAPTGVVAYVSYGREHLALGNLLAELFQKAGWRNMGSNSLSPPANVQKTAPVYLVMAFLLPSTHQVETAMQAVGEVLYRLGFETISKEKEREYLGGHHDRLRLMVLFGERERLWSLTR
jgi:hypothetical protein